MNWYLEVVKKYAVFSGRAQRMEYWMFALFNVIIAFALGIFEGIFGAIIGSDLNILSFLYAAAILLPSLAVTVRRLHDTGRSGWWLFIGLIPVIGWIALLVFYVQDSQPGQNQYGSNPKEITS